MNLEGNPKIEIYKPRIEEWKQKTEAEIIDETKFTEIKKQGQFYVAGFAGFAGSWSRSGLEGKELEEHVEKVRAAIKAELIRLKEKYGEKLIVSSGATNKGVLQIVYEECENLNIVAMGVTSDATLKYDVGKMKYFIPFGKEWSEESPIFVRISDELVVLGGGKQSQTEAEEMIKTGKSVTIIQGFGGIADMVTEKELPGAHFIKKQ